MSGSLCIAAIAPRVPKSFSLRTKLAMGLLPDTSNCGLRYRERFPRHRGLTLGQRRACRPNFSLRSAQLTCLCGSLMSPSSIHIGVHSGNYISWAICDYISVIFPVVIIPRINFTIDENYHHGNGETYPRRPNCYGTPLSDFLLRAISELILS